MGAGPSQNNEPSPNTIIQDEKLIISPKYDSEKIFKTILDITSEILSNDYPNMQYNDCNDMNFLHIKDSEPIEFSDLKMIVEKANTKQKLLLAKTYKEKKDEKFTIRNIAELKDLFYKNKVELNPEILKSIKLYDPEVSRNIFSGSVLPFFYIDQYHVNRLFQQLEYKNPVNVNEQNNNGQLNNSISINKETEMSGGEQPEWMKKRDRYRNKKTYSDNANSVNNSSNEYKNRSSNPIENATFKSINKSNNVNADANTYGNANANKNGNANANGRLKVNENANSNTRLKVNENANSNENSNSNARLKVNANTNANRNVNTNSNRNVNTNKNTNENVNTNTNTNTNKNANYKTNRNESYNTNSAKYLPVKTTNYNRNKSKINQKNALIKKLMLQLEEQKKKFGNTTINKKPFIQLEQKPVQRQKFYYSVKDNFKPINFCYGRTDTCNLSKYQLCQLISQYFTVKLNIIAAILSCIPYKNGDKYEGNSVLCFKQLSNLDKCSLCVPYDYKDSMESNNRLAFIQKIARYSVNLNKDSCSKGGYFFTLSPKQAEILIVKLDKNDMNKKFFECRKKINEIYYENLTQLIEVLNKLKNASIINNSELNSISIETKTIIDRMNTLCSYYYIYGTIALINADVSTDVKTGERFFNPEYKKNSSIRSMNATNVKKMSNSSRANSQKLVNTTSRSNTR